MSTAPRIAFYGDDFTGATDTLATAARAGLKTLLFLRVPDAAQLARAGALDCVGIAGAARSLAPDAMAEELAPVAAYFRNCGARWLHYKTCSTFDSAVEVGSIGAAVRALLPATGHPWAAIVGGQPNLGRYCLFGNLFASAGTGGEVFRIDRHPTMRAHPVTPMHEADLRRHLAQQGLSRVGLVPWPVYEQGREALQQRVSEALAARPQALLFDVGTETHLRALGAELSRHAERAPLLAVGSSSVVQAFSATEASTGTPSSITPIAPARGPVLALAGSLSPATARQVAVAGKAFETVWLDPERLMEPDGAALSAYARDLSARLLQGHHVLACTVPPRAQASDSTNGASSIRAKVSAHALAAATGTLLARVLTAVPLARVGIAGGDTSSHAVKALDAWGLSYLGSLAPGVALCRVHSDRPALDGMELMLKGGQMGGDDLFELLLSGTPGC